MKIGILGTGTVARTLGARLMELGHEVTLGTRDVAQTMARTDPDPFGIWLNENPGAKVGSFAEASRSAEVAINATNGMGSLDALRQAGASSLNGKILVDIANPLDFSSGMPPSLAVANTDSLGEQIQRAFPNVRVVKTLNTVTASLMVDPGQLDGGDHHIFVRVMKLKPRPRSATGLRPGLDGNILSIWVTSLPRAAQKCT